MIAAYQACQKTLAGWVAVLLLCFAVAVAALIATMSPVSAFRPEPDDMSANILGSYGHLFVTWFNCGAEQRGIPDLVCSRRRSPYIHQESQ